MLPILQRRALAIFTSLLLVTTALAPARAVEPAPMTGHYANPLADEAGWLEGFGTLRAHRIASDGRMRVTAGSTSVRAFAEPLRGRGSFAQRFGAHRDI